MNKDLGSNKEPTAEGEAWTEEGLYVEPEHWERARDWGV